MMYSKALGGRNRVACLDTVETVWQAKKRGVPDSCDED
jgi:hypothetical protein